MLEPSLFHLLKLHGSVAWDSSSGAVRKGHGSQPDDPVLIYPSAAKYQLPYLEFMSRFQIALRRPDIGLAVVGFGFNDAHIVALSRRHCAATSGCECGLQAKSPSRPLTTSRPKRTKGLA